MVLNHSDHKEARRKTPCFAAFAVIISISDFKLTHHLYFHFLDECPAALSLHMATRITPTADNQSQKFFGEGLTFDDVLLCPAIARYYPEMLISRTRLTKDITLNVPMLSAAMDTVTEANLAIALAREGGLGILHKNMTIEEQAAQVRKVKRSESGLILDPVTLTSKCNDR